MFSLAELWHQLGYQIVYTILLFLYHRWQFSYVKKRNRLRDIRISRLERTVFPMNIIQVPAAKNQWGLSSIISGVPGRLGFKVNKIIIHWIDGNLATADTVFTGKTNRKVSSHFAVEDETIHQYVSVNNTAWQAGNWLMNLQSIGIEHSAQPERDTSDATYKTSGALIAQLWTQFGMSPSRDTLVPHGKVVATQCPGTVNLDRLYNEALANHNGVSVLASAQVAPQVHFEPFVNDLSPSQVYREEVKRVQEFLIWQEFLSMDSGFGFYGPKTEASIEVMKKKYGHANNGSWDNDARGIANGILLRQSTHNQTE